MQTNPQPSQFSRRSLLASAAVLAGTTLASTNAKQIQAMPIQVPQDSVPDRFKITNRRIRQSVMGWCFKPMPESELIDHCAEIGLEAIEGIDAKFYPLAKAKGLKIALVGSHGFAQVQ